MSRIYLDHNATTPLEEAVLEAMLPYLREHFGNPSSIHRFGQDARRATDHARQQVAELVNADPSEIVFTGSGTEADNLALRGPFQRAPAGAHLVTTAVEHPAVLNPCTLLERRGVGVARVGVDATGRVDPAAVAGALRPESALVSVMLANNDVGTIQPVAEIAALLGEARERGLLLHSDAVQGAGKLPLDVEELGVDLLSLSAHKIGGPKGCGALYVRRAAAGRIDPVIVGGAQERGRRAGTENVAAIVGFGRACELARQRLADSARRVTALRDRLQQGILARVPGVRVNGHPTQRLPNTLNVTFPGLRLDGEALLMNLDLLGIAVSTGSACSSGSLDPSHVLLAMGLSVDEARSAIRFSLGAENTEEEMDAAAAAAAQIVGQLQGTATHG